MCIRDSQDSTYTEGFRVVDSRKIQFKTAPTVDDVFWGNIIANTIETFDLADLKVDNFTGNGTTTQFTLSRAVPNNESIMVTIDGVLQHPSDKDTTRAYRVLSDSVIEFSSPPPNHGNIQVRHLGFAGASTGDVSGFYGRTGNVVLGASDHITTGDITPRNINASGIVTASSFVGNLTGNVSGNLTVGGVLTYEDVTNVDSIGIITARSDIHVGAGVSVVGVSTFSEDIIVNGLTVGKGASSGNNNTALGAGAFDRTGIGAQNTAIGNNALTNNQNGSGNTVVGHDAAFSNVNGLSNTAVGRDALRSNNNSSGNTAIGRAALYYNSAENNTALGQNSLFNVGAGKSNTAVGQSAGNNIVSGSNNLVLGYNAQATAANVSNEITLGNSLMNHLRVPGIGVSFSEGGAVISGIVTTTELDISGDIDVDGHTNLDNVSIAGVATVTGALSANNGISVSGDVLSIAAASDIRFTNSSGTWSGSVPKIQHYNNTLYIVGGTGGIRFREMGTDRWDINGLSLIHISEPTRPY